MLASKRITMVTKEEIIEKLKGVKDPEIGLDLVNLGLIYDVSVDNGKVTVKMTLTFPGCPLGQWMIAQVEKAIREIPGVTNVEIQLVFDPPWTPERITEEGKKLLGLEE